MKKELGVHNFARDDHVMNAVDHFLGTKIAPSTQKAFIWTKCINVGGDYVENLLQLIF